MPINEATIAKAHLYPELLPDARYVTAAAGSEVSPPILDVRRYKPKMLQLAEISVEQSATAQIRARNDYERVEISCAGLRDQLADPWEMTALEFLYYNLYGVVGGGGITNFRTHFGVWVWQPSIACKLMHGVTLNAQEQKIAEKLNIQKTVEKGLLPLPIPYVLEREYMLISNKVPYVYAGAVTTSETTVGNVVTKPDEIIVLEGISASPGIVADNVRIRIDRDDDADYIELPTFAMALSKNINCWIPALNEIRIKVLGANATTTAVRYTVGRYKLTNILRARFGLISQDEAPGDVWEKVMGGVL